MAPPESFPNVSSIGTDTDKVDRIHVKHLVGVESVSYAPSVLSQSPDIETLVGMTFNTSTNAITSLENHTCAGTLNVTGIFTPTGHINLANQSYFISGDGQVNKGITANTAGDIFCKQRIIVTGETIHNDILRQNAAIDMASNDINGTGGAGGLNFNGGINANFSGSILVNNNIVTTTGYINCGNYIVSTNSITSGGYVKADTGAEFRHGTNNGISTTVDFSTYNGILTYSGGILTNKS